MLTKWKIDREHSEVMFKVKYLMITEVTGCLTSFDLEFQTEGNHFAQITDVLFIADINSLNTNNEKRDKHLMSADFFDAKNHAHAVFSGNTFEQLGKDPSAIMSVYRKDYKLCGDLTIKGITQPVNLNGYFKGTAIDSLSRKRAGFNFQGKICRKDFNMNWKGITEAGTLILGEDIEIFGNIQLIKQEQEALRGAA